jgi:hypothetical protein
MKLHRLLILSGLLIGIAPGAAYAGCAASCKNCRYEAAGNYFYCGDTAVRGPRQRVVDAQPAAGGASRGGTAAAASSRSANPKLSNPQASPGAIKRNGITSPRDPASGQSAGKS